MYFFINNELTNANTGLWYYEPGPKTAFCTWEIDFNNFKHLTIASDTGSFHVLPVTCSITPQGTPRFVITPSWSLVPICRLDLGDPTTGIGGMEYNVDVQSVPPFDGEAALVQVGDFDFSWPFFYQTDCRDGSEFYDPPVQVHGPFWRNGPVFGDRPGRLFMFCALAPIRLKAAFRDYIVFKPNGGIWVAVGIATWSIDGEASGVWDEPTHRFVMLLTQNVIVGPTLQLYEGFPEYGSILSMYSGLFRF